MIPHNVELSARWKDEPFVLLGINSDAGSRDDLKQKFESNGIRYPNILEGSTEGPIQMAWGIPGWPTLVVIDKDGVIRYRGHGDEGAQKKCEDLLGAMKKAGGENAK